MQNMPSLYRVKDVSRNSYRTEDEDCSETKRGKHLSLSWCNCAVEAVLPLIISNC